MCFKIGDKIILKEKFDDTLNVSKFLNKWINKIMTVKYIIRETIYVEENTWLWNEKWIKPFEPIEFIIEEEFSV